MDDTIHLAFDATATPVSLTGAGYYVQELLRELNNRDDIMLTIISRKGDGQRFSSFAPGARIVEAAPRNTASRIIFQTQSMGKMVDSLDVDVFHGPHYQLPLKMRTPAAVTIHDLTFFTHPNVHTRIKKFFFSRVIPRSLRSARAVITVSEYTADDIARLFGDTIGSSKVFVAPLGVDRERFHTTIDELERKHDRELLSSRGIFGDYISFLGLIEPRKSIPTLINAFALIADSFPKVRLVIAGGQGWGIELVREAIRKSGVSTRIVLPGRLQTQEVGALLRNTRVFVYPSLYEGFGMPVLEAMACGAPTITSNSSSMKEVAGNGAMLMEPGNVEHLAKLLESLMSHENIRKQMVKKALLRANSFSWQKCAEAHVEAYRSVLAYTH